MAYEILADKDAEELACRAAKYADSDTEYYFGEVTSKEAMTHWGKVYDAYIKYWTEWKICS